MYKVVSSVYLLVESVFLNKKEKILLKKEKKTCLGGMEKKGKKKKPQLYTSEPEKVPVLNEAMMHYQTMSSNPVSLLNSSKHGLSAKAALDFIAISGFTYDEFQETFKTTVKTIQNYAVQDLKLDAPLSEKLLRSFALYNRGAEVFGSIRAFQEWLNTSSVGLGNQIPFDLMDTITGIDLIEEELIRIEYGALA